MKRLKTALIMSCVLLLASTTAYLLEAQESKDSSSVDFGGRSIKIVSRDEGLASPEKEKYAFLVAAFSYDTGLASLAYPGNDVDDLKARLIQIGFREENIVVLRSGLDFGTVPTKAHIEDRYAELLARVKKGDLVFVYLSGHGLQLDGSNVSYFAPVDVRLK